MYSTSCKTIVTALFVISGLQFAFADTTGYVHTDQDTKRAFSRDCDTGYSLKCMKLDIVSYVEKLAETEEFSIVPGLSVVKDKSANDSSTADIVSDLARSFPNDPEKRLDSFLIHKLTGYLGTHTLRLKLLDSEAVEEARSAVTGRKKEGGFGGGGGGGKKGGMGGLIAAAMMMKGTLMSIGLGALALLAGKALMTALMALMLSAIVGLKSLTSGGHKSTTYEIVAKPIYSNSHSHSSSHEDVHGGHGGGHGGHTGYGGYGRSLNFALPEHLKN